MTANYANSPTEPEDWILVRGARQLLTLHSRNPLRRGVELSQIGLIVDGSVLIRNGIVDSVGPTRRVENLRNARNARVIDASGRVVMPAFVDPHACLVPVPRCRQEQSAKPVNALPASRLEAQAENLLKVMARHGTGTVGGVSGYGCDETGELKILRAMRSLKNRPLDVAPIFLVRQADEGGARIDLLHTVAKRQLTGIAAVRCGEGAVPWEAAAAYLREARSFGLRIQLEVLANRDPNAVTGAVNLRSLAVSAACPLTNPEIERLAASETIATFFPCHSSGGREDARRLIERDGLVALASGLDPQTGSTANMQTVIQQACESFNLTLEEAISAATVNAAWALGFGEHAGALEYRKQADLVLLNVSDYREIPLFAGTNLVHSLMKRGETIFSDDFPGWPVRD